MWRGGGSSLQGPAACRELALAAAARSATASRAGASRPAAECPISAQCAWADREWEGARRGRRAPAVPVGLSPDRGGGAGWQGERTASAPFVASEQLSFCAKTAASKQRLRQFHSANDDVRRPSGPRRPYAHPSSTTTDRARKRASPNYFFPPAHPFDCCSSSGAAVQRFSQQRHLGGIGAPAAAEQPLAYTGASLSRAHAGAARAGAELSRGAGTLLPAVRSGHWCLSSPPRQPGSGGAAAVECLTTHAQHRSRPASIGGTGPLF